MKLLFSLEQYCKIFPRFRQKLSQCSQYGKKLIESRKLRRFYGKLSKKYLQSLYQKTTLASQNSTSFFWKLESRLDVVLYRAYFFQSIATANQQIRIGAIKVNNVKVISPSYNLSPGDIISVLPSSVSPFIEIDSSGKEKSDEDKKERRFRTKQSKKKRGWYFQRSYFFISLLSSISRFMTKKRVSFSSDQLLFPLATRSHFLQHNKQDISRKVEGYTFHDLSLHGYKSSYISSRYHALIESFPCKTKGEALDKKIYDLKSKWLSNSFVTRYNEIRFEQFTTIDSKDQRFLKSSFAKTCALKKHNKEISYSSQPLYKSRESVIDRIKVNQINDWLFSCFIVFLKNQGRTLRKRNFLFFKKQRSSADRKTKPLHLEISYRSLSIVFLFPPQRVCFPFFINLSQIYK